MLPRRLRRGGKKGVRLGGEKRGGEETPEEGGGEGTNRSVINENPFCGNPFARDLREVQKSQARKASNELGLEKYRGRKWDWRRASKFF